MTEVARDKFGKNITGTISSIKHAPANNYTKPETDQFLRESWSISLDDAIMESGISVDKPSMIVSW